MSILFTINVFLFLLLLLFPVLFYSLFWLHFLQESFAAIVLYFDSFYFIIFSSLQPNAPCLFWWKWFFTVGKMNEFICMPHLFSLHRIPRCQCYRSFFFLVRWIMRCSSSSFEIVSYSLNVRACYVLTSIFFLSRFMLSIDFMPTFVIRTRKNEQTNHFFLPPPGFFRYLCKICAF